MTRQTLILIALLIVISGPFAFIDYAHFPYSDGAEHGAAVRALAKDLLHPGDPMLTGTSGASPRYVPSILIMALFMKATGLDVLVVLQIFVLAGLAFFLIAAALFSKEYFTDIGQAPWSLAFLLFFWGPGWTGSNAFMFSAILYTAYYPSVVSFSLAFLALYFQLCFLHCQRRGFLAAAIFSGALCFVNHPLTGAFFYISSALLYLERGGVTKKTVAYYALSIIASLCLAVLWPYYSFFSSFMTVASGTMQKTIDYNLTHQYLYSQPLLRSGPALAGIPIVLFYCVQRRYLLLWGGFLLFSLMYLAGFSGTFSLAERCIFFILCMLQLAASRACREWTAAHNRQTASRPGKILSRILLLLLAAGITIQSALVLTEFLYPGLSSAAGSPLPRYVNPNAMQHELKRYLHEGDVVLSDIYSSWAVPVYTGAKIVALFHTAPHIRDNISRIDDVETFYTGTTTNARRREIVKKYGVTHIFLHFKINGKQLEPVLQEMGYPVVARTDSFCIFSVPK